MTNYAISCSFLHAHFFELNSICQECDLSFCSCNSHYNESVCFSLESNNDELQLTSIQRNISSSEIVNMVPVQQQQDMCCTNDDLNVSVSTRPSTDIDSIPSNLTNDTCVSYATFSGADISASGQTPAEQQGSYSDSSLSQGGDYTSLYYSLGTDDASITINGMSYDTGSSQSSSNYLLDLGLKCKGFRMGHINIQGISNKIDQILLFNGTQSLKTVWKMY